MRYSFFYITTNKTNMYKNFYGKLSTKRNIKKFEQKLEQNKKKQDRAYFYLEHLENLQSLHKEYNKEKTHEKEYIKMIKHAQNKLEHQNKKIHTTQMCLCKMREKHIINLISNPISKAHIMWKNLYLKVKIINDLCPTFEELCLKHFIKENTFQLNKEKEKLSELIVCCDNITSLLKEGDEPFLKETYYEVSKLVIKQNKKVNKVHTRLDGYHQKLDAY